MRLLSAFLISTLMMMTSLSANALSLEVGAGYGLLDLSNPDGSDARSTGMGGTIAAYYSVFGNENYDFGVKGSAYYAQLDNDVNTAFLNEETEYYNVGLGLELAVHDFFASWQYKYNRIDIELSGNINNTSAFSDYMSQFELGYIFHVSTMMQVRLVYQRTDGTLPMIDTDLSTDTDFTSNAFMVVLRFDLSSKKSSEDPYRYNYGNEDYQSRDSARDRADENESGYVPSHRSYRYAPRPSPRIK